MQDLVSVSLSLADQPKIMAEFKTIKTRVVAHRVVHREFPLVGIEADNSAPAAICYQHRRHDLLLGGGAIGLCGAPGEQERGTQSEAAMHDSVLLAASVGQYLIPR
jgi:hypothetical protein